MGFRRVGIGLLISLLALAPVTPAPAAPEAQDTAAPPASPVKVIFIHHSTGGHWLADTHRGQPYGGLGRALMENNYYLSATNYGWGPEAIGDRTDIPDWPEWFLGPNREAILDAVYSEDEQNAGDFGDWSRLGREPEGENQVVLFKSCFPNSALAGNPDDPPLDSPSGREMTVANAKAIYNALLSYFRSRPDKLFVVITAPPLMAGATTPGQAANARAFNDWLVHDWLRDYPYANVAVFDYYNVLTGADNHHRWNRGEIEHVQGTASNVSAYPTGDSHPSTEGHQKATAEFVPLLNVYVRRWRAGEVVPVATAVAAEPEDGGGQGGAAGAGEGQGMALAGAIVDDFESGVTWQADGGEGGRVACVSTGAAHSGTGALRMVYATSQAGGGCWRGFEPAQDWSSHRGLVFWITGQGVEQRVTFVLFTGDADAPTPYEVRITAAADWDLVALAWNDLVLAPWADEGSPATPDPARVLGLSFAPDMGEGAIGVDDMAFFDGEVLSASPGAAPETAPASEPEPVASATPDATELEESGALALGEPVDEPVTEPEQPGESVRKAQGGPFSGVCALAPLILSAVVVGVVWRRHIRSD